MFQPATRIAVSGGLITIAGPAGYCVDRSATRNSRQGVFVLLGSCASIGNNAGFAAPDVAGALTASVASEKGADINSALGRLGSFFRSNEGRMALARNGNPASVQVLSSRRSRGVLIMKVRDNSPNAVNGLKRDYWRALFDVRGRIVTLSVNSFNKKPMSDADGFATLAKFVARVRTENPALVDPVADPV